MKVINKLPLNKLFKFFIALIVFDIASKLFVYVFVDDYLVNKNIVDSQFASIWGKNIHVSICLFCSVLGAVAVFSILKITKIKKPYRIILSIISVPIILFSLILLLAFIHFQFTDKTNGYLFIRVGQIFLWSLLFIGADTYYFKVTFLISISGLIGNILSNFYPPYYPIDFLFINGRVYNFADAYIYLNYLLIIISPVVFLIKYVYIKYSRRGNLTSNSS
jgi:hypothetical protein